MASQHNLTTAMPTQFLCVVDKKWEPTNHFSKKQLRIFTNKKLNNSRGTTAANAGLKCRKHSGEPVTELQCLGPCGEWKDLTAFSKSSRKESGRRWCFHCVQWSEADQSGFVPLPAPMGQRSAEERELHGNKLRTQADMIGDEDDDGDDADCYFDDYDDDTDLIPGPSATTAPIPRSAPSAPSKPIDPPFPRAPHHLLPPMASNLYGSTQPTTNYTYDPASAPSATGSTATTRDQAPRQQQAPVRFTAYGPEGQIQQRTRPPTTARDTASESSAAIPREDGRGGWARPASRKTPLEAPDYLEYEDPNKIKDNFDGDGDHQQYWSDDEKA